MRDGGVGQRRVEAARRIGENQGTHPLGMGDRRLQPAPAAHGLADQGRRPDSLGIEDRQNVAGEVVAGEMRPIAARAPEAAVVEDDDPVAPGKGRHLLPPARTIAAAAVGEDHRRPSPMDLVVELRPLRFDRRHAIPHTNRTQRFHSPRKDTNDI